MVYQWNVTILLTDFQYVFTVGKVISEDRVIGQGVQVTSFQI